MKTTKLLSIALVTMIALTVVGAAGVMTAPKAAASPRTTDYTITVGKDAIWGWGGRPFNYHEMNSFIEPGVSAWHAEKSIGNTISTKIMWATSSYAVQGSSASVGVKIRLAGTYTQEQWNEISATQVVLKTVVLYKLATSTGGITILDFGTPIYMGALTFTTLKEVKGGSAFGVSSKEMKLHLYNIVHEYQRGSGVYEGWIYVGLYSTPQIFETGSLPLGSASGSAVVANIQLLWAN